MSNCGSCQVFCQGNPRIHPGIAKVGQEIAGNAKVVEILEKVGAVLDNATMQELNRQVEVDKKEPRAVAAAFLKAKGVLR